MTFAQKHLATIFAIMVAACLTSSFAAEPQWKDIFNGRSLDGWQEFHGTTGNWAAVDGLLHCKGEHGGASIESTADYANFELSLEYRTEKGGNSGVYLRVPDDLKADQNPSYSGMEIQILDDTDPQYANIRPVQFCGSIYGVVPAKTEFIKPAGQWGKMDILCDHRHVKVTLNDHEIVDANLDDYPKSYHTHPGIRPEATTGHIGLQYHTGKLDFRNIRIRVLP